MLHSLRPGRSRRPNRVALRLQSFEDRLVPAIINLTTVGAEGTANGAIFRQAAAFPEGSDQFQTFVRLDDNWIEQGYNTDARPLQFDEVCDPAVTHSLQLGSVPKVTVDGVVYREFLLNVNEPYFRRFLSLDQLRIFVGETGDLRGYNVWTRRLAGLTAVYDMDAVRNTSVILNGNLNQGTGVGDAVVLIPDSVFAGADATDYVYLFSRFGALFGANGGYEEWGVRPVVEPPPPQPASLSGFVYIDANNNGIKEPDEGGLAGVVIQLQQFDEATGSYEQIGSAVTDENGFYQFSDLTVGVKYALAEETPVGSFIDGLDTIGSQGGVTDNDFFFDIVLKEGEAGVNNNFGERQ